MAARKRKGPKPAHKPKAGVSKVCELIKEGLDLERAAEYIQLDPSRITLWMEKEPKVKRLILQAMAERELELLRTVKKGGLGLSQAKASLELLKLTDSKYLPKTKAVVEDEISKFLERLEQKLDPEVFKKVLMAAKEN